MFLTLLTGRKRRAYYVRVAIDKLNKTIENLERDRQDYLEKAAMELEKAKKYIRENDIDSGKHCIRIHLINEKSAQHCQELLLPLYANVHPLERMRLQLLMEDHLTPHNPMCLHVFTMSLAFCFFLVFFYYFVFV